jgi:hypothetical protein
MQRGAEHTEATKQKMRAKWTPERRKSASGRMKRAMTELWARKREEASQVAENKPL